MKHRIETIRMAKSWLSYIGAAYGILEHAGFWDGSVAQLSGMCGLAFQFIVHRDLCPSSVTVYDWGTTHWSAMDRIGVYTDFLAVYLYPGMNTQDALMADAQLKIKDSIDRGIGVLTWAPTPVLEFGIITGYDDAQQIFHVIDCARENPDPLLYNNLGKSRVPFLYIQRFIGRQPVRTDKIYTDALLNAVRIWNTPHPNKLYAQGERAYDNLVASLESKSFDAFGLVYIVNVYADAKKMISQFMQKINETEIIPKLEQIIPLYTETEHHFEAMASFLPFTGPGQAAIDESTLPEIAAHAKESRKLETEAMKKLKSILEI